MIRIPELEDRGACAAAMTGTADGDCGIQAPDPAPCDAVLAALGYTSSDLVRVRQVHGDTVHAVNTPADPLAPPPEADALITAAPGILLAISVADCIPVFVLAPGRAAGLAHAGREGTRLGIAAATVQAMVAQYALRPEDLHAWIGPGAGPCCYEVTPAMAAAWRAEALPVSGRHLDLWAANRQHLLRAGVPAGQISQSGHCTICQGEFFSHRRDAAPARNLALLGIRE